MNSNEYRPGEISASEQEEKQQPEPTLRDIERRLRSIQAALNEMSMSNSGGGSWDDY